MSSSLPDTADHHMVFARGAGQCARAVAGGGLHDHHPPHLLTLLVGLVDEKVSECAQEPA